MGPATRPPPQDPSPLQPQVARARPLRPLSKGHRPPCRPLVFPPQSCPGRPLRLLPVTLLNPSGGLSVKQPLSAEASPRGRGEAAGERVLNERVRGCWGKVAPSPTHLCVHLHALVCQERSPGLRSVPQARPAAGVIPKLLTVTPITPAPPPGSVYPSERKIRPPPPPAPGARAGFLGKEAVGTSGSLC